MTALLQRYRRLSAVMVLTLGSQALSASSTLLLHLLGLYAADTYSIAAQIGLTGFNGVTVGILYNIAIGRPGFRAWRVWAIVAATVSVGAAVFQGVLLSNTGFVGTHGPTFVWLALGLFAGGGVFISIAATDGVREACHGRPLLFASTSVYPNAGLLIGIVIGAITRIAIAPAIGWLVASTVLFIVARRTRHRQQIDALAHSVLGTDVKDELRTQIAGLLLGVLASTLMPILYLAALSQLAVGVVYVATLVSRIVNASVALTVNSALLVRFNWTANREKLGPSSLVTGSAFAISMTGAAITSGTGMTAPLMNGIVVCGWLFGVIASSILIRHLNATRRGRTILVKSVVEVVVTGTFAALLFSRPTFAGYFGCFALSSAMTILAGGLALRNRMISIAGGLSFLATAFIVYAA